MASLDLGCTENCFKISGNLALDKGIEFVSAHVDDSVIVLRSCEIFICFPGCRSCSKKDMILYDFDAYENEPPRSSEVILNALDEYAFDE